MPIYWPVAGAVARSGGGSAGAVAGVVAEAAGGGADGAGAGAGAAEPPPPDSTRSVSVGSLDSYRVSVAMVRRIDGSTFDAPYRASSDLSPSL
jgi:hypothetical protein